MNPPIFQLAIASGAVTALLGVDPTRFWSFGEAPADESGVGAKKPYAVWQVIDGSPGNNLSSRPQFDDCVVMVDCYAKSAAVAKQIQIALRDALELSAHIVKWNGESHEPATGLYRYGFNVEFSTDRT
jgi:hypothetical protein